MTSDTLIANVGMKETALSLNFGSRYIESLFITGLPKDRKGPQTTANKYRNDHKRPQTADSNCHPTETLHVT